MATRFTKTEIGTCQAKTQMLSLQPNSRSAVNNPVFTLSTLVTKFTQRHSTVSTLSSFLALEVFEPVEEFGTHSNSFQRQWGHGTRWLATFLGVACLPRSVCWSKPCRARLSRGCRWACLRNLFLPCCPCEGILQSFLGMS